MAVTKIWAIKDSLQRVLDYAANPDKTEYDALAQTLHYAENDAKTKLNESAQLITGIHCRADYLRKLGISADKAYQWGNSRLGYWRIAGSPVLTRSNTNERLAAAGYFSILNYYESLHLCG